MNPQHFHAHVGHGCTGGGVGGTLHPPQAQEGFHQLTVQPIMEAWMDTVRRDMVQRQDADDKGSVWPASFILSDIRGLVGLTGKNKSPFLHDLATQRNCLWMAVTETWLTPRVLDSEILVHVPRYSLIGQDRNGRPRGGVCLFLREDLTGEIVTSYSNGVCELLVVHVHQVNTIVVVVYRDLSLDSRNSLQL